MAQIDEALRHSRVVIAAIGTRWLDEAGTRRLNDPNDLLRIELETALKSGIAIVPITVGGAAMPPESALPPTLRRLAILETLRLADEDWAYDFGRLLECLERHGVLPSYDPRTGEDIDFRQKVSAARKYERTFQASRRRMFDAVVGAVELLRYAQSEVSPEAARVTFQAIQRPVTATVVDAGPGTSTVVVSFNSARTGHLATAAAAVTLVASPVLALGWPALRAWERRFARGFLDNVQNVLEGRGVGEDSALPPGIQAWRNRKREV